MRGLERVHGHGYIHRDIEQDNILLYLPGSLDKNAFVVKLADFGCAALKEACIGSAGARRMMGPELPFCARSGMWSAGYVLYAPPAGALPPCSLEVAEDGWSAVPALKNEHCQEGNLFCEFLDLRHLYMSASASKSWLQRHHLRDCDCLPFDGAARSGADHKKDWKRCWGPVKFLGKPCLLLSLFLFKCKGVTFSFLEYGTAACWTNVHWSWEKLGAPKDVSSVSVNVSLTAHIASSTIISTSPLG